MNPQYYEWLWNEIRRLRTEIQDLYNQCSHKSDYPYLSKTCDICKTRKKLHDELFDNRCAVQEMWDEFKNVCK